MEPWNSKDEEMAHALIGVFVLVIAMAIGYYEFFCK